MANRRTVNRNRRAPRVEEEPEVVEEVKVEEPRVYRGLKKTFTVKYKDGKTKGETTIRAASVAHAYALFVKKHPDVEFTITEEDE